MTDCPRTTDQALFNCPTCGATDNEECGFADMTPGLLESHPITAGQAVSCDPTDGVCESCQ